MAGLGGVAVPTAAQDYHYWTNQYGTQAQLLGGAVVGAALGAGYVGSRKLDQADADEDEVEKVEKGESS